MSLTNSYAWFVRGATHAAMCRTSVESVKKADPKARCIVVTDERQHDWDIPGVLHLQIDEGLPIMLANLEAQVSAMSAAWNDNHEQIVFLDTDTLMLKPMECFGDIAFTYRDNVGIDDNGEKVEGVAARMPFNYGVVIARPSLKSFEAMLWIRERIRSMHYTHQHWYGNQLAAAELGGRMPDKDVEIVDRVIPWKLTKAGKTLQVGKIPCERFNYTPQALDEDVTEKFVLHFKGARRDLMKPYAERLGLNWYVQDQSRATDESVRAA